MGALPASCAFALLAYDARQQRVRNWDGQLLDFLHGYESPTPVNATVDHVINGILILGADILVATVLLVSAVVLALQRRLRQLAFVAASAVGIVVLTPLLKTAFDRTSTEYSDFSFPSGHAMRSLLLGAVLVTLAWRTRWRWPAILAGGTFAGAVGVMVVYEAWHLPSDVLGGWTAVIAWVVAVGVTSLMTTRGRDGSPPGLVESREPRRENRRDGRPSPPHAGRR